MSPIARNRSSLLGSNDDGGHASTIDLDMAEEKQKEAEVEVQKNVQPMLASVFLWGVTSLLTPSYFTAAVRLGIVGVAAHLAPAAYNDVSSWMATDDSTLQELVQTARGPPVTHWKGMVDMQCVVRFGKACERYSRRQQCSSVPSVNCLYCGRARQNL
jgi:hypothetical protein